MRRILLVALLVSLCQGCFVFEEIDKGQQLLDQHSPAAREKAAQREEAAASPPGARQEEGILERLANWWKQSHKPAPPKRDPDDLVVRCQIGRTMQFTRKSDCMLRGGRVI